MNDTRGCRSCRKGYTCPSCRRRAQSMPPQDMQTMQATHDFITQTVITPAAVESATSSASSCDTSSSSSSYSSDTGGSSTCGPDF